MTPQPRPARTGALAVAGIATVAPLFCARYLPFTDLPEHVAVMASLRHYWDPAWRIQEHYDLALGRSQYLLYHLVGAALSFVVSAETANRLILAAVGVAFPFAFRKLLRAFGKDERLAICACPIFWNRTLVVGFLPYVASIPALMFALALAIDQAAMPTGRRARWLFVVSIALFYLHVNAFVLFIAISLTHWLATPAGASPWDRVRAMPKQFVWLAPSLVAAALWLMIGKMTLRGDSLSSSGEIGQMSALRSANAFSLWSHDIWRSHVDEAIAAVFWLAFIAILLSGARAMARGGPRSDPSVVPLACAAILYIAVPFRVGAGTMLNVRMAPVVVLFAVLALPAASGWIGRTALAWMWLITFVTGANSAFEIRRLEQEEVGDFDTLLEHTKPGSRLVTLSFHQGAQRTHFPPWLHIGAYHRARKGGVAAFSFSALAHWPLQYTKEAAPPSKPAFWDFHPCLFRNEDDGPYYDYVLVRGTVDPFRDEPPGPAWHAIARARDFTLFEKVPGASYPPWSTPDRGPCVDRSTARQEHP